ncbi:NAD-dependent epimerase/dehydratase family protein [Evansella clarkii]|uniref:NAD-dependent epimerase/dehydratase family protein n=1 Tax=Evansella clarkii TaxID=79879 RepID=UPI000B440EFD|nr:NAD-dependent epimerase/dehydratase family protein [Evansella clarkii]
MRVLVIGGRGFIGPYVVNQLLGKGHQVTLFNRGQTNTKDFQNIPHIKGDFEELEKYKEQFKEINPDVVLHMVAMNERVAKKTVDVFEGIARRIVVPSSMDVYKAYGIVRKKEDAELIPTPMSESAPLRSNYFPHGGETEKILVEKAVLSNPKLPGTILRLPMVYGPGDEYRIFNYLKRMIDNRPFIVMDRERAKWRGTRGYVENVASAIAAAIVDENAKNKIYNVGDNYILSEQEFVEQIAGAINWNGEIKLISRSDIPTELVDYLPVHIVGNNNYKQDWVTDTSLIRRELNYKDVVPLNQAIKSTVIWNQTNQPKKQHKDFNPSENDYKYEDKILELL